jgi:hypothetical protein
MNNFAKFVTVLGASALFGCAASVQHAGQSDYAKWEVIDGYEAALPTLVSWGDYGSASRVALAIAYERNGLEGASPEVCQALSQSRDLLQMASNGRSREDLSVLADIQARTGSMTRERATCAHAQEVAARGIAGGF